ncbi:MAG: UrcA family protein [Steroidobacteraceae bacterium]
MSHMNRKPGRTAAPLMTALFCTAAFMATSAMAAERAGDTVRVNDPIRVTDSIGVSYAAADVVQPEAAKALYLHIQRAAKMVCREPDIRDLAIYSAYQQCFDRAVEDAVEKVNVSTLTALHRSKVQHSTAGQADRAGDDQLAG